jgi:N-acetylmuramic acid 6-phosphate (MurNAc-6-P) etherase
MLGKVATKRLIDQEKANKRLSQESKELVDAKSALNANHTASRTKLASHAQRVKDVPDNFS